MHNYVKLTLTKTKHYQYDDADTDAMSLLGDFLVSDVRCGKSWFREWVCNETSSQYGGNITHLEREGDYIIVSDQYSEEPDDGPYFKIKKETFVRLLDQWGKVCKEKPQEILITYDGEHFTFESEIN